MATVFDPAVVGRLGARLDALTEEATPAWGRMSAGGMVCHLGDVFLTVLGDRPTAHRPTFVGKTLIRLLALHTPFPWPKGAPAPAEVDQEKGGTPPGDFDEDRRRLRAVLDRFASEAQGTTMFHPIFGQLTSAELGRWGYRHVDHHLRQFGV